MDRFSNVRNYLNSVNRSVLLAIGLVLIAGLIAAVFVYGETEDGDTDTNGTQITQETAPNTSDPVAATGEGAENNNENSEATVAADEDETVGESTTETADALPNELAQTGPATPAIALGLLGASAYLYRRSRREMVAVRLQV